MFSLLATVFLVVPFELYDMRVLFEHGALLLLSFLLSGVPVLVVMTQHAMHDVMYGSARPMFSTFVMIWVFKEIRILCTHHYLYLWKDTRAYSVEDILDPYLCSVKSVRHDSQASI